MQTPRAPETSHGLVYRMPMLTLRGPTRGKGFLLEGSKAQAQAFGASSSSPGSVTLQVFCRAWAQVDNTGRLCPHLFFPSLIPEQPSLQGFTSFCWRRRETPGGKGVSSDVEEELKPTPGLQVSTSWALRAHVHRASPSGGPIPALPSSAPFLPVSCCVHLPFLPDSGRGHRGLHLPSQTTATIILTSVARLPHRPHAVCPHSSSAHSANPPKPLPRARRCSRRCRPRHIGRGAPEPVFWEREQWPGGQPTDTNTQMF